MEDSSGGQSGTSGESPIHSLTAWYSANKQRKLVLSPDFVNHSGAYNPTCHMRQIDRRTQALFMLLTLLIASTACHKHPTAPECDVLSAFIDGNFASRKGVQPIEPTGNGIVRIVIFNLTESDQDGQNVRMDGNGQPIPWAQTASSLQSSVPTLNRTTMVAFRDANRQQASLRRSLHPAIDYDLVDSKQLEFIFKRGGGDWPAFYKRFPGSSGIMSFSRVGFSQDGTQALFYVSNHCGGLCGVGMYVVMEKRSGSWAIEKQIEMWIS
jgi:hypothetical protein